MRTALLELQKAIYTSLSSHTPLTDKVQGILDDTDADQLFPYVVIGEPSSVPAYTKTSTREEIAWTLHCWSQYQGKRESFEILSLMNEAFTQQPLSLDGGFSVSSFQAEQMQVFTDIDGETRHGILRVRFIVHQ